jgi:hypothetical protein
VARRVEIGVGRGRRSNRASRGGPEPYLSQDEERLLDVVRDLVLMTDSDADVRREVTAMMRARGIGNVASVSRLSSLQLREAAHFLRVGVWLETLVASHVVA